MKNHFFSTSTINAVTGAVRLTFSLTLLCQINVNITSPEKSKTRLNFYQFCVHAPVPVLRLSINFLRLYARGASSIVTAPERHQGGSPGPWRGETEQKRQNRDLRGPIGNNRDQ